MHGMPYKNPCRHLLLGLTYCDIVRLLDPHVRLHLLGGPCADSGLVGLSSVRKSDSLTGRWELPMLCMSLIVLLTGSSIRDVPSAVLSGCCYVGPVTLPGDGFQTSTGPILQRRPYAITTSHWIGIYVSTVDMDSKVAVKVAYSNSESYAHPRPPVGSVRRKRCVASRAFVCYAWDKETSMLLRMISLRRGLHLPAVRAT